MNYPFWDVGIGYGYLMAAIAVLHVFISHFAIGGGLYLVVVETAARKRGDQETLGYLKRLSKFFILTSLVMGAITGVAIWFIIGLLNPAATEALIHNFVWGWATEWTFFVVEVAAAILYYYGWERMSAKNHLILGWIYFIAAWLSLVVINGIIGYMLTPGDWLSTGNFWDGFLNPTYWSSLWFRTGICVMLAGLYAQLVASGITNGDTKGRLSRLNTHWLLAGLLILAPSGWWYWQSIPAEIRDTAQAAMPSVMTHICQTIWLTGVILVLAVVIGYVLARRLNRAMAVVMMIAGLLFFGAFEWSRESIRKPYAIYGYMYGNGIDVAMTEQLKSDGMLAHIAFRTGNDGADLFRRACRSCHTISGYKPLKPAFDGTDPAFIVGIVKSTHKLRGNMPPFLGNETEAKAIADHLYEQLDHRPLSQIYGLSGVELGKKAYEIRCGKCHVIGGFNDKSETIAGASDDDYANLRSSSGELDEFMPGYTGSDEDWNAMVEYLKTLTPGGK
jgi:mono/diheme cytochrome c family protein